MVKELQAFMNKKVNNYIINMFLYFEFVFLIVTFFCLKNRYIWKSKILKFMCCHFLDTPHKCRDNLRWTPIKLFVSLEFNFQNETKNVVDRNGQIVFKILLEILIVYLNLELETYLETILYHLWINDETIHITNL